MNERANVSGNTATKVVGKAFDFEYAPGDTPNVVGNKADEIHDGGSAFTGRIAGEVHPRPPAPWWQSALLWVLKTTVGKAVGVGLGLLLAAAFGLKASGTI